MQLEWFTHSIDESGEHAMHIRPWNSHDSKDIVVLDIHASRRLTLELNRAAMDLSCDFSSEKQRILARYYERCCAEMVQAA